MITPQYGEWDSRVKISNIGPLSPCQIWYKRGMVDKVSRVKCANVGPLSLSLIQEHLGTAWDLHVQVRISNHYSNGSRTGGVTFANIGHLSPYFDVITPWYGEQDSRVNTADIGNFKSLF